MQEKKLVTNKKRVLVIIGSASEQSANQQLMEYFAALTKHYFDTTFSPDLKRLPHFNPQLSLNQPPEAITALRESIDNAEGVIICTPEYVFSIPSGLKNALEWCVATTVFNEKPVGLITASAQGHKGHEELQLLMKTVMAKFTPATTILIPGIRGKVTASGEIIDEKTKEDLGNFAEAFKALIDGALPQSNSPETKMQVGK